MNPPRRQRVLVTGHSGHDAHRKAFRAGRNASPHDVLIVLTSDPHSADLAQLQEDVRLDGTRITIHSVDGDDLNDCLRVAQETLAKCDTKTTTVHVTGGRRLLTTALMLAAFQQGTRSYYWGSRGATWLPFPDVAIADRFSAVEKHVLRTATPTEATPISSLCNGPYARDDVLTAIRRLKRNGFVEANPAQVELTAQGRYSRETLIHQAADASAAPSLTPSKRAQKKTRSPPPPKRPTDARTKRSRKADQPGSETHKPARDTSTSSST